MTIRLLQLDVQADENGKLIDLANKIPFKIARLYYIYDIRGVRGCHAHYDLEQVFICMRGACTVVTDDGKERQEIRLSSPSVGLYVDKLTWIEMKDFTDDCFLIVHADKPYDAADYIHDYETFRQAAAKKNHVMDLK